MQNTGINIYLPFGELFVSQRNSTFDSRYKFSAKELDNETGYSYFGARYYDSNLSIWLSVDPLSDKFPSLSPYNYCAGNPVMLVDPDGRKIVPKSADDNKSANAALFTHFESKFGTNISNVMLNMIACKDEFENKAFGKNTGVDLIKQFDELVKDLDKSSRKEAKAYKEKIVSNDPIYIFVDPRAITTDGDTEADFKNATNFKNEGTMKFDEFEFDYNMTNRWNTTSYDSDPNSGNAKLFIIKTVGKVKMDAQGQIYEFPLNQQENNAITNEILN